MNDTGTGAGSASTGGLPLDPELHALFRSATDDVHLRHGPDDVLQAARSSEQPTASRRRAIVGGLAVAAAVLAVVGVGATQLPSVTPAPSGPAATPSPGERPETGPPDDGHASTPLTFFFDGRGTGPAAGEGLVSRARPDLDLAGAVAATIRGEGEPPGRRTAWLDVEPDRSIDVRTSEPGVVEVDFATPRALIGCAGSPQCAGIPLSGEPARQRLAFQQVAWTVAAYQGPDTSVRFLLAGRPFSELDVDMPELVYADPAVFADLQVLRPAAGLQARRSLILEGWTAQPTSVRWTLRRSVPAGSVLADPMDATRSGKETAETDPVTGRGFFSVVLTFDRMIDPGLGALDPGRYTLMIQVPGARTQRSVIIRPQDLPQDDSSQPSGRPVPPSNQEQLDRATAILEAVGVDRPGEAEPAHGSASASMGGDWRDGASVQFFLSSQRILGDQEVTGTLSIGGVKHELIAPTDRLGRQCGDDYVTMTVYDEPSLFGDPLPDATRSFAEALADSGACERF